MGPSYWGFEILFLIRLVTHLIELLSYNAYYPMRGWDIDIPFSLESHALAAWQISSKAITSTNNGT